MIISNIIYTFAIHELIINFSMKHGGMKPQDVVVLLKMIALNNESWTSARLAAELKISASEVSGALERCRIAKLVDNTKRKVNVLALEDFLVHGLKYVYPPQPGAIVRGVATSFSAEPIKSKIRQGSDSFVWPYKHGSDRGQSVEPLYRTVPEACLKDSLLYELLVIADTLRMGRVREMEIAVNELKIRLDDYAKS